MSRIREIVESVLKEELPRSYDYWRTTNPDYEEEGAYEDWLDAQESEATKYAVFVEIVPSYGKEYVDLNTEDGNRTLELNNNLTTDYEPEIKNLWDTEEEAQAIANEYLQQNPNKQAKVVKVFTKDMNIWDDDPEKIWTNEDYKEDKYGY